MKALPYHYYSSYNKKGGKQHPTVLRRANMVLDLYAAFLTIEAISEQLDIPVDTIKHYIRRGKIRNDPRAMRPNSMDRKRMNARTRRIQVRMMTRAGFTASEIAKHLECSQRLVQMRIKEASIVDDNR